MANYTTAQIQAMITSAALSAGVPPSVALAVAQQESGFNPNAVSQPNSNGTQDYGVFQINSSNLASLGLTSNPLDPEANINAGVNLLAQYLTQYGGNVQTALWAYNAGPGDVSNGVLPASTSSYIAAVTAAIPNFDSTVPGDLTSDGTDDSTDAGVLDLSGTVSLFGYDVPTEWVLTGALGVGLLLFALRD